MAEKMFIIVNPVSANKTTGRDWPTFEKLLLDLGYEFESALTERPGHASELAKEALKSGYKTIVSVGGDGTMNEVVNGFFENGLPLEKTSRLVMFSRGTGCDLIKTLGIKKDIEGLTEILGRNQTKQVDVGRVVFDDEAGNKAERYFLNIADIGIGAEVANRVNKHSKVLKGFLSFALSAVSTIIFYRNKNFKIVIDNETVLDERLNSVIIANGRYFGGGMKVAPNALMDDGLFDVIVIGNLSKLELIKSFPQIYDGRHLSHPKLKSFRGRNVKVSCGSKGLLEVDGEIPGRDDAEFELLPKILNILV